MTPREAAYFIIGIGVGLDKKPGSLPSPDFDLEELDAMTAKARQLVTPGSKPTLEVQAIVSQYAVRIYNRGSA